MPLGGALTLGISAGSSLLSGLFGGKAAKTAAQQQQAAAQKGIAVQGNQVQQNNQDLWDSQAWENQAVQGGVNGAQQLLSPEISTGNYALNSLQDLSGANGPLTNKFSFNPSDLQKDPGYAFTLQQGQDAIQRSAAAQGKLFSGGTLKSLAGYTTGTANQYFNDAFNRNLTTFNTNQQQALSRIGTLQGLAGLGSTATGQAAGLNYSGGALTSANDQASAAQRVAAGTHYADAATGLLTNQGNAQAQGTQNQTASWLNALNTGTQSTLQYLAGQTPAAQASPGATIAPGSFGTLASPSTAPYGPPPAPPAAYQTLPLTLSPAQTQIGFGG